jgi:hypothetical protein
MGLTWLLAMSSTLLVVGCSSGQTATSSGTTGTRPTSSGTTTGAPSPLGQECNTETACGGGLTCYTNVPEGYCSKSCNSDADCPSGGSCVAPFPGEQICALACSSVILCNRLGFLCDVDCSVCVPDNVEGLVSCSGHVLGGGGHLPDGGACGASLSDGGFVSWSSAVEVSANPLTASEAEGSLLVSSATGLVTAFMVVPADAGSPPPQSWIGLATSVDDGVSFASQTPLVSASPFAGDPTLATDANGNLYLAYFGYDPTSGGAGHLWVSTSTSGTSWSTPQDVLGPGDLFDGGGGIDKPFLAVDPVTQQPLIVFSDFAGLFPGPGRIRLIAGQVGGASFSPSVNVDDGARPAFRDLPSMAFDQTGMVYLAWVEATDTSIIVEDQATGNQLAGSPTNAIYFTTASIRDGGVVVPQSTNHLVSGDAGASVVIDSAHLAVAPDGTETYVVYVVAGDGGGTDIELAVSHDQGFSWPVHTLVDDQPGCATHFHPAPFLDVKNRIWVSWVDNRDGLGNVYYAFSTNAGASFSPSQLVSSTPFFFTTFIATTTGNLPAWLGGYQALTGTNSELDALWTGAEGGTGPDSPAHVYFAKAPLP